jgi:hypothetical protein
MKDPSNRSFPHSRTGRHPLRRRRACPSWPDLSDEALLVDLAHRVPRDAVHNHHDLRDLVGHDTLLHCLTHVQWTPLLAILATRLALGGKYDDSADFLTPFLGRHTDDGAFLNLRSDVLLVSGQSAMQT